MATSLTHKYIPRVEQTEENLFMEEYYSSTDTKIIMDGVEQTEIGYINYSLQEQLKPLYGYASRTFDDVAVGNRIVTGTFKVPIKNPEAQTPMQTIIERGKDSNLDDYNDNQDDLMDSVDWITGQDKPEDPDGDTVYVESDQMFEYRTKLIKLGYDLDYDSSLSVYERELKKFQSSNGIDSTGKLTSQTMDAIDKALTGSIGMETMTLPRGTKVYLGPASTFDNWVTQEDQTVFILDDAYDDGWVYIMTKDGQEGFINKNTI